MYAGSIKFVLKNQNSCTGWFVVSLKDLPLLERPGEFPCSDNKPASIVGNSWKNKSDALKALEMCSFLWGGCIKEAYA